MLKHTKPTSLRVCLHVSSLACMRSNLEANVLNLYKGKVPVLVNPGRIVPHLVRQHGFTLSYDLNKHKTRESYAGLPPSEECLGGRRSEARRSGFHSKPRSGASEYLKDLHVALAHA